MRYKTKSQPSEFFDERHQNNILRRQKLLYLRSKTATENSPLWKRVIAWERSRAASGYGIIWGDADRNKQGGI